MIQENKNSISQLLFYGLSKKAGGFIWKKI